jgi:hypothetical protein
MPSASPGRYQSRLFNFLNRQTLRFTDKFDRTIRHLKVAATWGAQILLYPVYLLVQTSLSVGRQLTAEAEAGWPRLKEFTNKEEKQPQTPLTTDTPIQQVLNEVSTLSLPEPLGLVVSPSGGLVGVGNQELAKKQDATATGELSTASALANHPDSSCDGRCLIQGVASLLDTHSLVLVTVENQILDILTPEQQRKLTAKISWEVANLLRQRRLAYQSNQSVPHRLTSLNRPRVFLPIKILWQVMEWVQTSQVAITANLFQESALIQAEALSSGQIVSHHPTSASNDPILQDRLALLDMLAFLDLTIAELESHQLVPGTEALIRLRDSLQNSWQSSPLAQVPHTVVTLRDRTQQLTQQLKTPFITPKESELSPEASQSQASGTKALIYAAIEYFFGKRGSNLSGTDAQERSPKLTSKAVHQIAGNHSPALTPAQSHPNPELSNTGESGFWLSWSDLFGNSDSSTHNQQFCQELESTIPNSNAQAQLPEAFNSKIPARLGNSVEGFVKRFLSFRQSPDKLSAPSTEEITDESQASNIQADKLITTQKVPPLSTQKKGKGRNLKTRQNSSSVAVAAQRSTSISPAREESTACSIADEQTAIATSSSSSQSTELEPAPDWIETRATTTGYVKHPLEQLLQWLDRSILRIEELAVKVWQWLRRFGKP